MSSVGEQDFEMSEQDVEMSEQDVDTTSSPRKSRPREMIDAPNKKQAVSCFGGESTLSSSEGGMMEDKEREISRSPVASMGVQAVKATTPLAKAHQKSNIDHGKERPNRKNEHNSGVTSKEEDAPLKVTKHVKRYKESRNVHDLLARQAKYCPRILKELQQNGRKTSHWAWWVFPTQKPGFSEPYPQTFITHEERADFLSLSEGNGWRACLELVAKFVKSRGLREVLPSIDHGRVEFFCKFWDGPDFEPPAWLKEVIAVLKDGQKSTKKIKLRSFPFHKRTKDSDNDRSDDSDNDSDQWKS